MSTGNGQWASQAVDGIGFVARNGYCIFSRWMCGLIRGLSKAPRSFDYILNRILCFHPSRYHNFGVRVSRYELSGFLPLTFPRLIATLSSPPYYYNLFQR
jgi:hypothetical protein